MKLLFQSVLMVILILGLTACMSEKEKAFRKEGSVKPMMIPAGYSSSKIENYYQVPNLSRKASHTKNGNDTVSLVPPGAHKHGK